MISTWFPGLVLYLSQYWVFDNDVCVGGYPVRGRGGGEVAAPATLLTCYTYMNYYNGLFALSSKPPSKHFDWIMHLNMNFPYEGVGVETDIFHITSLLYKITFQYGNLVLLTKAGLGDSCLPSHTAGEKTHSNLKNHCNTKRSHSITMNHWRTDSCFNHLWSIVNPWL